VAADPSGKYRVILAADYQRLEFLRVLRHLGTTPVSDTARIIGPQLPKPEVTQ
jgi:rod shape-determining protein MreC